MILGIDEVGRGPWAGPLVVGAVVLNGAWIDGLTDSKKLTKKQREQLCDEITSSDASVGLGWVHAKELDEIGLSRSLVEATKRAVDQITTPYHEIIIDGTVNFLSGTRKGQYVTTMKKADLLIPSVSAASIVAKVARDEYMRLQDDINDGYHFASHVGYGTAAHRAAIEQRGVTAEHRLSFAPLAEYRMNIDEEVPATGDTVTSLTTKQIGNDSEQLAAEYLVLHGYEVVERNWKTRLCEIDIVARKEDSLYFVEVKQRKNAKAGDGISAITRKKYRQMKFAARLYLHYHQVDTDARLAVIATSGVPAFVESYIEIE